MKRFLTSVFFVLLAMMAYSQKVDKPLYDVQQFLIAEQDVSIEDAINDKIVGTPYLENEFKEGLIRFNGEWYKGIYMRFDAVHDQMQAKLKDKGIVALDPRVDPIDSIQFNNELFVAKKLRGFSKKVYIVSMYTNNGVSLLKKHKKTLRPEKPTNGIVPAQPAEYVNSSPEYYIESEDKLISVKSFYDYAEAFNVSKKEIKKLAKENKLKKNSEEDLITMMELLNGK